MLGLCFHSARALRGSRAALEGSVRLGPEPRQPRGRHQPCAFASPAAASPRRTWRKSRAESCPLSRCCSGRAKETPAPQKAACFRFCLCASSICHPPDQRRDAATPDLQRANLRMRGPTAHARTPDKMARRKLSQRLQIHSSRSHLPGEVCV